ncbi:MAG: hypothetical protein LLG02_09490 [Pelosinus sp.]|nr:hypothetical protein [Pelosinus sp.]
MSSAENIKIVAVHNYVSSVDEKQILEDGQELSVFIPFKKIQIAYSQEQNLYRITYCMKSPLPVTNEYWHICMNVCEDILGLAAIVEVEEEPQNQLYVKYKIYSAATAAACTQENVINLKGYLECKKRLLFHEDIILDGRA